MASVRGVAALCKHMGSLSLGARPASALLTPSASASALANPSFLQVINA